MARFSGGSGGGEGTPGPEGPAGPPGADANTGDITFDGIQIIGAGTASGDGGGYGTMQLVPDGDLTSDQYLIIDPTAPNHIHIRAGGTQDASTADLILGGENTNVLVSDTGDYVDIRTTSVDSNTYIYRFDSAGYLSGPAMGGLFVSGLLNGEGDLWLGSSDNNVILSPGPENSAYLGDASTVNNQIATIGDFGYLEISSATDPLEGPLTTLTAPSNLTIQTGGEPAGEITIQADKGLRINYSSEIGGAYLNGNEDYPETQIATIGDINNTVSAITSYSPVWSGTGLAFSGTPATGTYVKIGNLVQVQIDVNFTNVTNFGTGQYSVTLPFTSKYHTDVFGGSIHNTGSPTDHYSLKGHLLPTSSAMTLWYIAGSSQDQIFDHNSPITLNTTDKFHMSFSYICE
jgi:hypothetical protein